MIVVFKKIAPWLVSAALCLLAAEALGAAVFLYRTGRLPYGNTDRVAESHVPTTAGYKPRLHPYFGYTGPYSLVSKTEGADNTNNLGFVQRVEGRERIVPFKSEPNEFVVFVFGASVAAAVVNSPRGSASLRDNLQKLDQLKGRNVVVYSVTQGPQKQPQQLIELAFLLAIGQRIDLVLNIGGTVEFTSGLHNFESGVDPIFPHAGMLRTIGQDISKVGSGSLDYYETRFQLERNHAGFRSYLKRVPESTSGLDYLWNRFMLGYYSRSYSRDLLDYDRLLGRSGGSDEWMSLDMPLTVTKDNLLEVIFQRWLRCSDMMKLLVTSNGATYLEIVHPNPYHSKKKLTQSERALLDLPETHYLPRGAAEGYRLIEQRSDVLKSHEIVNALTLFDDVSEAVYEDSTGHFNRLGESLFGQFVAEQVAARLGLESPKSQLARESLPDGESAKGRR